ncbi:RNA-guided endonuclease InsQ/TnpB family protein [Candidatus Hakubella thermalkaliphila]|uniref:RNA-guided endonuclease InsQ/TnpB family protein n=1 Tax=Candidatus Hakubella thermalkaliphila TaxID=2754717 RepID=UPI001FEAD7AD
MKVKWHRCLPDTAIINTVSFKREPDGWHVIFSCELPEVEIITTLSAAVGIDLGLKSFLATSNGESIDPPRFYRQAQDKLRRAQRAVARKKKGSNRRRKAVQHLAKLHQHIKNQRKDFHHKLTLSLVRQYGTIAHENLNIKGIARTSLAKSTHDVGWAQFLAILSYKAAEAGTSVIAIPANNTTQACSVCGALPVTPLTLKDRVYSCAHCHQVSDRDLNAARNVLRLGLSLQTLT